MLYHLFHYEFSSSCGVLKLKFAWESSEDILAGFIVCAFLRTQVKELSLHQQMKLARYAITSKYNNPILISFEIGVKLTSVLRVPYSRLLLMDFSTCRHTILLVLE